MNVDYGPPKDAPSLGSRPFVNVFVTSVAARYFPPVGEGTGPFRRPALTFVRPEGMAVYIDGEGLSGDELVKVGAAMEPKR